MPGAHPRPGVVAGGDGGRASRFPDPGCAGSQGRQWSEQEGSPGSFEGKATAGGALDRPQALRSPQGGVRGWGRWRAQVGAPPRQGHPTLVVNPPLVTPHPGSFLLCLTPPLHLVPL